MQTKKRKRHHHHKHEAEAEEFDAGSASANDRATWRCGQPGGGPAASAAHAHQVHA